jgi:hypothetical protein
MVRDIHKLLWISLTAALCSTELRKRFIWLSESLSMDQLVLNIKSVGICSDKKDLVVIFSLGKLEKIYRFLLVKRLERMGETRTLTPKALVSKAIPSTKAAVRV